MINVISHICISYLVSRCTGARCMVHGREDAIKLRIGYTKPESDVCARYACGIGNSNRNRYSNRYSNVMYICVCVVNYVCGWVVNWNGGNRSLTLTLTHMNTRSTALSAPTGLS